MRSTPTHAPVPLVLQVVTVPQQSIIANLNLVKMVEPVLMAMAASRVYVPQHMERLTAQHVCWWLSNAFVCRCADDQ